MYVFFALLPGRAYRYQNRITTVILAFLDPVYYNQFSTISQFFGQYVFVKISQKWLLIFNSFPVLSSQKGFFRLVFVFIFGNFPKKTQKVTKRLQNLCIFSLFFSIEKKRPKRSLFISFYELICLIII